MPHLTLPLRNFAFAAIRPSVTRGVRVVCLLLNVITSALVTQPAQSEPVVQASSASAAATPLTSHQRERAIAALRATVRGQPQWIKIHAAEFLLDVNLPEGVRDHFREELAAHEADPQYRIGVWRVLSRCPSPPAERSEYVVKIVDAAFDPDGPDRLHAIEALAKLNVQLTRDQQQQVLQWVAQASDAETPFGHWLLALQRDTNDRQPQWDALLRSAAHDAPLRRLRAAFALEKALSLPEQQGANLIRLAAAVGSAAPKQDSLRQLADAQLLAAAWSIAHATQDISHAEQFRAALQLRAANSDPVNRIFVDHLAQLGKVRDVKPLTSLLAASDPDLAASAAHALLRIEQRTLAERD